MYNGLDRLLMNVSGWPNQNKMNLFGGAPFGLGPMGFGLGMQGIGMLLGLLQGNPYEKYNKAGLNAARQTLETNPNVLNVGRAIGMNRASMMPQLGRMAESTNKTLGINTGRGQLEYLKKLLEQEMGFNVEASLENDRLKSMRNMNLMQLLSSAGGR